MKNVTSIAVALLLSILFLSCESALNTTKDESSKGVLTISFTKKLIESPLKSLNIEENNTPKYLVISVKDENGNYLYDFQKFELYKFGDGYLTKNISLKTGNYTIEDFIVLNDLDSVIYLTPKTDSDYEELVSTPLPFDFNISEDNTTEVILEVIPANLDTADKYGYAVFGFNILKSYVSQPDAFTGKDAYIEFYPYENYANRNFGSKIEFIANTWTAGGTSLIIRSLIEFDLSSLEPNTNIKKAFLYLYSINSPDHGNGHSTLSGSNDFLIKKITSPWNEDSVTWNTQPFVSDTNQVFVIGSDSTYQNYKIEITELARDMVKYPESNYGLMLMLQEEAIYRRILFASSDYPDKTKHPQIIITYY